MRCSVKYSELYKQLIGLIVFPLILSAIYILLMYVLKLAGVTEKVLDIYSLSGSVAVILLGVFIVKKMILIDADAEYDVNGIHIQLKNKSFLYNETFISLLYENIQNLTFNENDNYRIYVKIKTRLKGKVIFISPDKYENNSSFISYWNDVEEKIKNTVIKK